MGSEISQSLQALQNQVNKIHNNHREILYGIVPARL